MIWRDREVNLKILYCNLPDEYSHYSYANNIKKMKIEIGRLGIKRGLYISLNNIVIRTNEYLVLGILYVDDINIDMLLDELNLIVNSYLYKSKNNIHIECSCDSKKESEFSLFVNKLNNIETNIYKRNSDNKYVKSIANCDWEEYPSITLIKKKKIDLGEKTKFTSQKKYFLGILFNYDACVNIDSLCILNILRESVGDNDTDSVFFDIRKRGNIYSGYSKVFFDTATLLCGYFGGYTDSIYNEAKTKIVNKIKSLQVDVLELDRAKRKYINYFRIANLEYHKGYLLEPYFRYFQEIKDFEDIIKVIENIDIYSIENFMKNIKCKDVILEI